MFAAAVKYLGRKFIICVTAMALVTGVFVWLNKPELFGGYCLTISGLAVGFYGSNLAAGIKGLPGKSAQDAKDGDKPEE